MLNVSQAVKCMLSPRPVRTLALNLGAYSEFVVRTCPSQLVHAHGALLGARPLLGHGVTSVTILHLNSGFKTIVLKIRRGRIYKREGHITVEACQGHAPKAPMASGGLQCGSHLSNALQGLCINAASDGL